MELLTGLIIGAVGGYIFGKISERRHAEAYLSLRNIGCGMHASESKNESN